MANALTSSTGVVTGTSVVAFDVSRIPGKAALLATYALGTLGTSALIAMSAKSDFGTNKYSYANAEYGTFAQKSMLLNASGSYIIPITVTQTIKSLIIDVTYTGGSNAQTLALDILSE
jgi:hypothetical protein